MMPLRIKIIGDHSHYHCGSAAVFATLTRKLANTYQIVDSGDYDALYVNGEGSMHHNSGHFLSKMKEMQIALECGKQVYLVNSVWQQNNNDYDSVISKLSGITVREVLSQADLKQRHGVDADMFLDLSYYETIDESATHLDRAGQILITDFFSNDLGFWFRIASGPLASRSFIDLRSQSWSSLVKSMRTCRAVVSGRHHGVYAACVARRPFVAVSGNTHKIEGLKKASGFPIPVLSSARDANAMIRWAIDNRGMFVEFFHWMDEFPRWNP